MKRFVKLVAVALLVAVVIARWRRMQDTSRQASSGRREEPVSQDPGSASRPVQEETPGEAGEPESRVQATPAARRRAEELRVDLSQVEGTGSGGRITVKDVRSAAEKR
jgi:pyruvate/2-oxoglutarate dehydrogenase complex dihydrolipoamide acyltransferase (E2) component